MAPLTKLDKYNYDLLFKEDTLKKIRIRFTSADAYQIADISSELTASHREAFVEGHYIHIDDIEVSKYYVDEEEGYCDLLFFDVTEHDQLGGEN